MSPFTYPNFTTIFCPEDQFTIATYMLYMPVVDPVWIMTLLESKISTPPEDVFDHVMGLAYAVVLALTDVFASTVALPSSVGVSLLSAGVPSLLYVMYYSDVASLLAAVHSLYVGMSDYTSVGGFARKAGKLVPLDMGIAPVGIRHKKRVTWKDPGRPSLYVAVAVTYNAAVQPQRFRFRLVAVVVDYSFVVAVQLVPQFR